jgi:hypothetical protein
MKPGDRVQTTRGVVKSYSQWTDATIEAVSEKRIKVAGRWFSRDYPSSGAANLSVRPWPGESVDIMRAYAAVNGLRDAHISGCITADRADAIERACAVVADLLKGERR